MKSSRRHVGHALAGTMIFLVLLMLLWVGVCRQLASHLRIEKACQMRQGELVDCQRAMAWALTLLETGKPPILAAESCSFRMVLDEDTYVAIYTKTGGLDHHVEVRPMMYSDDELLPLAPPSF